MIRYISKGFIGSIHDFTLMKLEFMPGKNWFKDKRLRLDSGFQGFAKEYDALEVILPVKKPKNKPLSEKDKQENREKSSKRVFVEHCFGGLKRFRILSDRLRMHDFNLYDETLGICAGLWNLNLA